MKTAVIYARYSSDMQREESIEAQVRAITEYADANGFTIIGEYIDRAKSATTDHRQEFQRMVADAKAHKFQFIIIHKLDRFSRDRYDHAYYKRELRQAGVRLISVLERIDDSPESVIMESVLEGFSEYYSRNLGREVMKGLKENAIQCRHTGGFPPLGYDVDKDGHYVINEKEADAVRYLFTAYLNGVGYTKMVEWLKINEIIGKKSGGPIASNSIHDILQNEKYTGVFIFNRAASKDASGKRNNHKKKDESEIIRIDGGMPQIVSKDLFERVQKKMRQNKTGAHRAIEPYLLTGLLFCGECGGAMVGSSRGVPRSPTEGPKKYYECNVKKRQKTCKKKIVNRDDIENAVTGYLEGLVTKDTIDSISEWLTEDAKIYMKSAKDDLKAAKKDLAYVTKEVDRLLDLIIGGLDSEAARQKLKEAESKKLLLEVKVTDMEIAAESTAPISKTAIKGYLSQLENLHARDRTEQTQVIRQFVKRITVYDSPNERGWNADVDTIIGDFLKNREDRNGVGSSPPKKEPRK